MADEELKPQVTFVLTGPRKGFTGVLGGRYGFRDGKLTVNSDYKDKVALILCSRYCCNIEGENPIWAEKDGGSIKIGEMVKPESVVTAVVSDPVSSVVMPEVKVESKPVKSTGKVSDEVFGASVGTD